MKLRIFLLALAFPVLVQAQDSLPLQITPKAVASDTSPAQPMVLRKYVLTGSSDDAVAVAYYASTDSYRVELIAGKKKKILVEDATDKETDVEVFEAGGALSILTSHPTPEPPTLLIYQQKGDDALNWVRVYEKELQAKFDALLNQNKKADHYGLDVEAWTVTDDGKPLLVIEYRAVDSLREGRNLVIDKYFLFDLTTGTFKERK